MNKKSEKNVKLYNMILPIWMLLLSPGMWWLTIVGNLIIDSVLLLVSMKILKIKDIKFNFKKSFLKIYLMGFAADFISCVPMLIPMFFSESNSIFINKLIEGLLNNPFSNVYSFIWVTICVLITGIVIYLFDYKVALNKSGLDDIQKKKISLIMAIFTAPYLFYLPSYL